MIFNNDIMTRNSLKGFRLRSHQQCFVFHERAKDTSLILNSVLYPSTSRVYEIATHYSNYRILDFWHPLFSILANVETCKIYWRIYSNWTFEWYLGCIIRNYKVNYPRAKKFPDRKFVRNSPRLPYRPDDNLSSL